MNQEYWSLEDVYLYFSKNTPDLEADQRLTKFYLFLNDQTHPHEKNF
jgi:hypothetical protein